MCVRVRALCVCATVLAYVGECVRLRAGVRSCLCVAATADSSCVRLAVTHPPTAQNTQIKATAPPACYRDLYMVNATHGLAVAGVLFFLCVGTKCCCPF